MDSVAKKVNGLVLLYILFVDTLICCLTYTFLKENKWIIDGYPASINAIMLIIFCHHVSNLLAVI
jgi:uncharacterized membrane protein